MGSLLALPLFELRPNRLLPGDALGGFEVAPPLAWGLLVALLVAVAASAAAARWRAILLAAAADAALVLLAVLLGRGSTALLAGQPPLARVSLGVGAWGVLAGSAIVLFSAGQARPDVGTRIRVLSAVAAHAGWVAVAAFGVAGGFGDLGIGRELASQGSGFWRELTRHVLLAAAGVTLGTGLAVPLGILAARRPLLGRTIVAGAGIVQTIPSLALFGFLVAPLAALAAAVPLLARAGVRGIGVAPVVIALVVYALLPVVRNTYTALLEVDPVVRDAGRGMGMTPRQMLFAVELPLARPLILDGIRTAAVQLVGITALGAFIGAGGLGVFIVLGIGQTADDLILVGALPTIALAVVADRLLAGLAATLTPRGLIESRTPPQRVGAAGSLGGPT